MESNQTTWSPSQLCLICACSKVKIPPKAPIPVVLSCGIIEETQINCETTPIIKLESETKSDIKTKVRKPANKNESGSIIDHVKAIFVLRKLLNYPKKGCVKYLQLYGVNPGNWFTLCAPCSKKVGECYQLYRQLQKLEHRWTELKKELTTEVYNGKDKFVANSRRTKTKDVWQDVRDYVCGQHEHTHIAPVQKSSPQQLKAPQEPHSMFISHDDDTFPGQLESEDGGSDWEPEPEDGVVIKEDQELNEVSSEHEAMHNFQLQTSPRRPKRKASKIKIEFCPGKTPKIENAESDSTIVRDPAINPHIPLPSKNQHPHKCPLCVGYYKQRVKFDKHKALHDTQGGIPCEFCGWYHKPEYMHFHVNHFHKPRIINEDKKNQNSKEAKVKGEDDVSVNKDDGNATPITNQQDDAGPIKKTKKKWKRKKNQEEIVYYCDHCDMKGLHKGQLILHFEASHPGKEKLFCKICNENFVSSQLLQFHSNLVHPSPSKPPQIQAEEKGEKNDLSPSVHNCTQCDEVFSSAIKLDYHVLKCHKDAKWTCHCGYRTGRNCFWKAHLLTHTGEKPFACHFCDKVYAANLNLKNHMRQVHFKELGIDPLKCPVCEVKLLTTQAFKVHMDVTHGSQKTHCCEICGKMSGTKHNLKLHMITHGNVETSKPRHYSYVDGIYRCTFCDASYRKNVNIVKHLRNVHPERCEFKCAGCDTQFCSIQGLKKHHALCQPYRQTLPEPIIFKCKECDQVFSIKHQLRDHVVKVHCKYECDACGHKVNSENMMVRHKLKCFGTKLSSYFQKKAKTAKMVEVKNKSKFANSS